MLGWQHKLGMKVLLPLIWFVLRFAIVNAFETEWTRLWMTFHDGDDQIERELLTTLAAAKGVNI